MNEAHPGIELGPPLIFLERLVIVPRVREVVNGCDPMNQMIESALQGKPVVVFWPGAKLPRFERFHPASQGRVFVNVLVRRQSPKSALREMTMRRNKAGEDELSPGVIRGPRSDAWGRIAFADSLDLSVIAHQDVACEGLSLSRFHGQVCSVDD